MAVSPGFAYVSSLPGAVPPNLEMMPSRVAWHCLLCPTGSYLAGEPTWQSPGRCEGQILPVILLFLGYFKIHRLKSTCNDFVYNKLNHGYLIFIMCFALTSYIIFFGITDNFLTTTIQNTL